jgi:hypothetical protein
MQVADPVGKLEMVMHGISLRNPLPIAGAHQNGVSSLSKSDSIGDQGSTVRLGIPSMNAFSLLIPASI